MLCHMSVIVHPFFEPSTGCYSFIVTNPESRCCAIVDPLLGVNGHGVAEDTCTADLMIDWVRAHDFVVRWILETDVRADVPSAGGYLKSHLLCAQFAAGNGCADASAYDKVLVDGDALCLDHACGRVLSTPSHTPAGVSYQFGNAVLVGDAFTPGTSTPSGGQCQAMRRLLQLADDTRLYHRRDPNGIEQSGANRHRKFVTRVGEQRALHMASLSQTG